MCHSFYFRKPVGKTSMNITGIIAEYNPFHNGHAHHIACAKKETNADYIVVVMSGNFVQRGAPALLDKFTRAQMALANGADLVLELPVIWSCASAEYFAYGAVSLLEKLHIINTLCYGCETLNTELFEQVCQILLHETPQYKHILNTCLKSGNSYAYAREQAVFALLKTDTADLLRNPNNILALEYLKNIHKIAPDIRPHPILRTGVAYHSKELSSQFVSACAIRSALSQNNDLDYQRLKQAMPDSAYRLLTGYQNTYPFLYEDDCSQMLHYCLLRHCDNGFGNYADCSTDFSNRIQHLLGNYTGFSDFCNLLKTKNMAYTRISRILMHILLNIRQCDDSEGYRHLSVPYARILGFRKTALELLNNLKKYSDIPLLVRASDAKKVLVSKESMCVFQKNLFADSVYRALVLEKGGQKMPDEYRHPPCIL